MASLHLSHLSFGGGQPLLFGCRVSELRGLQGPLQLGRTPLVRRRYLQQLLSVCGLQFLQLGGVLRHQLLRFGGMVSLCGFACRRECSDL